MRIALLSDIHGNCIALEAVLSDIEQRGGADAVWILGDLVAIGHDPVGVLECLSALPNVRCARGNTDRYVCTGERPPPTLDQVWEDPESLLVLLEVEGTFSWTQGAITQGGWLEWLERLPLELREILPDGTHCLGVHAAPGTDDGPGVHPGMSETDLRTLLDHCQADLILVGHTHWPMVCRAAGRHVVNVGSVSNPLPPDLRAGYAVLHADESGYDLHYRRVDYDRDAVIAALKRLRLPGAGFVVKHMCGQVRPHYLRLANDHLRCVSWRETDQTIVSRRG